MDARWGAPPPNGAVVMHLLTMTRCAAVPFPAGYATDWRMLPAAVANTSNLLKDEAIALLKRYVGGRDAMLETVYNYWKAKRERLGKPVMRRLQAPTNPSDTNPFNVFR